MTCGSAINRESPGLSDKEMGMYLFGLSAWVDHRLPDLGGLYEQIPEKEWRACFGAYMRGLKGDKV